MSRRRKKLPTEPRQASIDSLSHDGRGVARVDDKVVFISGALPGESVMFRYTQRRGKFDEGAVVEVLEAAPQRIEPRCPHFGVCGGCSLQHLSPEDQIHAKQERLMDNLTRMGQVTPDEVLPPLTDAAWGYRRKARLGVRFMKREEVIRVGFRERNSRFLADLKTCEVLHPAVGHRLEALAEVINSLSIRDQIPQVEVAIGDDHMALVFRHLADLTEADAYALSAYGQSQDFIIFLQPGGPKTIHRLWPQQAEPEEVKLSYRLPKYEVELSFEPTDFTQVNAGINQKMIDQALGLLNPQPGERILDLFCGLGNFSLPLSRQAEQVVGVEGEAGLVARARANAEANGLSNVEFHATDLTGDIAAEPWYGRGFDKLLLDPPRSGAQVVVQNLPQPLPKGIVYVSCDPATLARDADILVHQQGYRLLKAGVMDMFPHTAHVESIAVFER
jgi:23S rRNA (uracil1939-C5)-methyltransferase